MCVQISGFESNRLAFVNFLSVAAVKSTEFKTSAQVWHGELNIRFSFFFTFPIWKICISYLKNLYFLFESFVFLIWIICISYLTHLYFLFDAIVFLTWTTWEETCITKSLDNWNIKESHYAINLWRDKVTILMARGQHHGVAALQCEGQFAEQLADSLAFIRALAPRQCGQLFASLELLRQYGNPPRSPQQRAGTQDPPGDRLPQCPWASAEQL